MGCNNSKQDGEKENTKKQSILRKVLPRFSSKKTSKARRPVSYAGVNHRDEENKLSNRPLSMFDTLPSNRLGTNASTYDLDNPDQITSDINLSSHYTSRSSSNIVESMTKVNSLEQSTNILHDDIDAKQMLDYLLPASRSNQSMMEKSENDAKEIDENNWKYYTPLTLEKIRTLPILKDIIYQNINNEFVHILNRLLRIEKHDENEEFLEWLIDELEYAMHSFDDDNQYEHKSLILRSIEQDRYDCMKYLLDRQLLPSKLDINTVNDQGRHCLLMLAHKNGPIDSVKYLLMRHLSCLDTSKFDLNNFSSLHHSCRHFNICLSELLLPHANKKILQMDNSELHTPLDYWIECLCSLKKLKPTNIQHNSDSLRLDYLLNDSDYHASVLFFQKMINNGGQLTKLPLRYIRSVLPQLSFENKLSYVDHHVHLCCMLYKNRLSTLMRDYDNMKVSVQAGEILTEFIYALGTVQLEVQNRLAAQTYKSVYETAIQRIYHDDNENDSDNQLKKKEHDLLQLNMRMLYFKFFRLFQCIYNNPDVHVKSFHFEHIFRRVWIYWKEPVKAFIMQCREKDSSLKSICRRLLFQRLNNYPADIQRLPINPFLKQFVAYDNPFFVVERKVFT